MGLRDIRYETRYRTGDHNLARDFYVPVLSKTVLYKRAVGFFRTSVLIHLSVGLYKMAENGGKIQLICSPELTEEDIKAIDTGYKKRNEVIANRLLESFSEPFGYFEKERLNLIATMIAEGMMDIKLAFMENPTPTNQYHEKIGVFIDKQGNRVAITGSSNDSQNGLEENFESFYVFRSWGDFSEQKVVDQAEDDFDEMWDDYRTTKKLVVIPFPKVVLEKLLSYKKDKLDRSVDNKQFRIGEYMQEPPLFHIPEYVKLRDYQVQAVNEWIKNDKKGIFSMATGTGKSFTALAGIVEMAQEYDDKIGVFIVCPYIHLVSQWEEDVIEWCPDPIIAHSKSTTKNWKEKIRKAIDRFKRLKKPFVCITTNDTFAGEYIQPYLKKIDPDDNVVLVVDEAHNFGAKYLSESLPVNISNRMALSATIERFMDKKGTQKLFDYFDKECINYSLEKAIQDGALVHYEYYPIPVYLNEDELQKYAAYTSELKKYIIEENGHIKISEQGKMILFRRSALLAGAEGKIQLIMDLMEERKNQKDILIYCGATSNYDEENDTLVRQIDLVTDLLRTQYHMSVQKFTSEENLKERESIKKYFAEGLYQVITAIKCLDAGVNIPGITYAFIMSSSRNPTQFIQRRGRLLRKSPGKEKAYIYDCITLPRDLDNVLPSQFMEDRSILIGEIARMEEFGRLSDNPEDELLLKNRIMLAYETFFDAEEEIKKLQEYYGDE